MLRCGVFEVVGLVDDEPPIWWEDSGLLPVLDLSPHGQVSRQQVMVDHHHIGIRRAAAGLEHETLIEVRTLETGAQIRFGTNLVPDFPRRFRCKIRQ